MRFQELKEEKPKSAFIIQNNSIKLNRVGPINAQNQKHKIGNVAPVNRGVWAFPAPFFDWFFAYHIVTKNLPKKFRRPNEMGLAAKISKADGKMVAPQEIKPYTDEWDQWEATTSYGKYKLELGDEEFYRQQAEAEKRIWKGFKIKQFWWSKPFYSRFGSPINPNCQQAGEDWYLWYSATEWEKYANQLSPYTKMMDPRSKTLYKPPHSKDHLELFIPM